MCKGLEKVIKVAGGQRLVGEILGVSQPAVAMWLAAGEVPWDKAVLLSFVFDIPLAQLCPGHVKATDELMDRARQLRHEHRDLRRKMRSLEEASSECSPS